MFCPFNLWPCSSALEPKSLIFELETRRMPNIRHMSFIILTLISIGMIYNPMRDFLSNRAPSDYYSHILLIPLISACLIFFKRKEIFSNADCCLKAGLISLLGLILFLWVRRLSGSISQNDYTSLVTFSALLLWVGGFAFFYGFDAFRAGFFPFLFLIFMIPIPTEIMERTIYALQLGSAEVTYVLFSVAGIPVMREGFVFNLPSVSIEVAKQCSGIRSTLAMIITCVLASHLFLRGTWQKLLLILCVFPVMVIKNGIRIVTLTLLAIYADMGFLTGGFLHKSGGFVFFIPALLLIGGIIWALRKSEKASFNTKL